MLVPKIVTALKDYNREILAFLIPGGGGSPRTTTAAGGGRVRPAQGKEAPEYLF